MRLAYCLFATCAVVLAIGWTAASSEKRGIDATLAELRDYKADFQEGVDGDTFIASFRGRREFVRLIGVNAPELDPPECFGPEARDRLTEILTGKHLMFHVGSGALREKHHRLIFYTDVDGQDIGLQLLREGYAKTTYGFPHPLEPLYLQAEAEAKRDALGKWGACP